MIDDPRAHAAYQAFSQVRAMQEIPQFSREHYLLNGPIADADRLAREIKQLRPSEAEARLHGIDVAKLMKRFHDYSHKVHRVHPPLETIHNSRSDETPRVRPIAPRHGQGRQVRENNNE